MIAPDVSGDVYVLKRAVRHLQAELELHIAAVPASPLDMFVEY
jgi:hypothetical protein